MRKLAQIGTTRPVRLEGRLGHYSSRFFFRRSSSNACCAARSCRPVSSSSSSSLTNARDRAKTTSVSRLIFAKALSGEGGGGRLLGFDHADKATPARGGQI